MVQRLIVGLGGGLLGAVVLGLVFQTMEDVTTLGELVGWDDPLVGWIVLLAGGVLLGFVYAVTFGLPVRGWVSGVVSGLVYGVLVWLLAGLVDAPVFRGTPVLEAGDEGLVSLGGHLLAGLLLGVLTGGTVALRR